MNSYSRHHDEQHTDLEQALAEILQQIQNAKSRNHAEDISPDASDAFAALRQLEHTPIDPDKLKVQLPEERFQSRRAAPRFAMKMTVIICNHLKIFCSESENISMTGLLLKDTLPEDFSRHSFDVLLIEEIGDKKNYLLFRGRAVEARLRTPRILFESHAVNCEAKIHSLLARLEKQPA